MGREKQSITVGFRKTLLYFREISLPRTGYKRVSIKGLELIEFTAVDNSGDNLKSKKKNSL